VRRRLFEGVNRRVVAGVAVSAALLVPLGVLGAPALARSASSASQYQYSGSAQYQYKVAVCHRTHSKKHPWVLVTVSSAAVKAHLKHGDQLAPPCPPATTAAAATADRGQGHAKAKHEDQGHAASTPTTASTPTQGATTGNSNGHGNGQGNGKDNGNSNGNGKGHGK
jgi:hypothetical protein